MRARRVHLTDPAKVGTYFARSTKAGNWQIGQWLPSGYVLVAQQLCRPTAEHIVQLLNTDRTRRPYAD